MITAKELREKYLQFFKEKGHAILPSASLIPEHDPSVLFTTAGMHPLVPFLLGEKHPSGKRLTNAQKCVRTSDIDSVGDAWHLTFFEMLGNWSLGDPSTPDGVGAGYWKKEAITWSWEFLTSKKWIGLDPTKIAVTVFAGDEDASRDEEAAKLWQKVGIPPERIYFLPKKDNWWGPPGETGPCGPCTEMFYDTGAKPCSSQCQPGCNCGKYAEIWNDVFMEYNKQKIQERFEYLPLKQKNVDTGMGIERTLAVLQGKKSVYETELFAPLIEKVMFFIGASNREEVLMANQKAIRIIVDHLRSATFILGDDFGVAPSNIGQGYVARRLIRRAMRYSRLLGIEKNIASEVAQAVINLMGEFYPELQRNQKRILDELAREEERFHRTLTRGLKEFENLVKKIINKKITGQQAFYLYESYGFPLEMTQELARERGLAIDEDGFRQALQKHQELSRLKSAEKFKGGLADQSEQVVKLHTANHLLLQALRQILGGHVLQKGSNITAKRLRFDFSHPQKLTQEQLQKAEEIVNQKIQENLPVICREMSVEEAKKIGAMGVFEHKYGDRVKVYFIGRDPETSSGLAPFSREICGGPHAQNTGVLGKFSIIKEEAAGAGIRRIKAVLGRAN